jgi:hypothetical protein
MRYRLVFFDIGGSFVASGSGRSFRGRRAPISARRLPTNVDPLICFLGGQPTDGRST